MFKIFKAFSKISSINYSFTSNISVRLFDKVLIHSFKRNYTESNNLTGNIMNFVPITVNNIRDNKGSRILKTRLGRGPGTGRGKTSGRGHKGFTARTGNPNRHFEGGQTSISRRFPKHGFRNKAFRENFSYINIDKILYLITKKRIDPSKPITIKEIFNAGGVSKVKEGIKLLSRGSEQLEKLPPLNIEVSSASQRAIDEIKKYGGTVTCIYKTPLTLRYLTKPHKFISEIMDSVPPFKKVTRLSHLEDKGAM
jgi:large subunit ribosomal protein L15